MITPRHVLPRLVLSLAAAAALCAVGLTAAEAPKAKQVPVRYSPANSQIVILADQPSDELRLAAASVGLPVIWQGSGKERTVAVIGRGGSWDFAGMEGSQNPEGYQVVNSPLNLVIVANSQRGVANGLYEFRRRWLACAHRDEVDVTKLLSRGVSKPAFAHRATYTFLAPWNLPNLNGAALSLDQWKAHLERMRRLGANQFYFDLWSDQFYHPDYPETFANRALYERMHEVCDYAQRLGLRTGMFVFPCQVPTSVFLKHPEARPVEAVNYRGIHVCPSKDWDLANTFNAYAINYFGESLDDVVVEMQDPGSCLCQDCCRQFPELVLRFIETYRLIPGGPADRRIDLCSLHFRDWLETPVIDSRVALPIKDLRRRVFERLPAGTLLLDCDRDTLELGQRYKLQPVYFFFDLDPESGLENQQVFPHVNLERTAGQVRDSVQRGAAGILDYRMMPRAQYVADYVLFRKLWDPYSMVDTALGELAGEWAISSSRAQFVVAIRDLDAWDRQRNLGALQEAAQQLAEIAAQVHPSELLYDLRDLATVEAVIGQFWSTHQESIARPDFYPPPELVEQVYRLMIDRPIFAAYTAHQHWELRARETIGQRLRWWLQALGAPKPPDG